MKHYVNFCKKMMTALIMSAAVLLTTLPTSAAEVSVRIPEENNVPVVYLNIDEEAEGFATIREMNESPDHSVRCTGTVRIDVPEGYQGDYSDEVLTDMEELQLDYVRGRGNVTWLAPKKAYKFKLDKKAALLGMGKNKHWALLANAFDGSMLRNRLVSYMGEQLEFEYTPKMLPVDLVINGEYMGSYYLAETVRIGKDRVNIDELTAEDNAEPEITGGYLLALNPFSIIKPEYNQNNTYKTDQSVLFWHEEPEFNTGSEDDGTPEQNADDTLWNLFLLSLFSILPF